MGLLFPLIPKSTSSPLFPLFGAGLTDFNHVDLNRDLDQLIYLKNNISELIDIFYFLKEQLKVVLGRYDLVVAYS